MAERTRYRPNLQLNHFEEGFKKDSWGPHTSPINSKASSSQLTRERDVIYARGRSSQGTQSVETLSALQGPEQLWATSRPCSSIRTSRLEAKYGTHAASAAELSAQETQMRVENRQMNPSAPLHGSRERWGSARFSGQRKQGPTLWLRNVRSQQLRSLLLIPLLRDVP